MAKLSDLIRAAEDAADDRLEEKNSLFEPSDPAFFPVIPEDHGEDVRLALRKRCDEDLFFFCKFALGYKKLRPEPHGELCAFLDFQDQAYDSGDYSLNKSIVLMPRDTFKTTVITIARNIRRAAKDPETRILIVGDTGGNASRFMTEIGNHFKFNTLLQWLYPECIPENFSSVRWNTKEIELKRRSPWREPTFDAMGAGGGIESRHYDHICADDLVTEKHIHSDTEMEALIAWLPSLEPLLVNDTESTLQFVGSRKKKGDAYEYLFKYFDDGEQAVEIGPHAVKRGELCIYSRSIMEDGKIIFEYDEKLGSGISMKYIMRMKTHDPERYHAQLANDPKASGLNWFDAKDLRYFKLRENGLIEAIHDGKLIERTSVWSMQRIILYDPSVAERKTSSKQAIGVWAKGSGPNRYLLERHYGHIPPDEVMELLFKLDRKWQPEFTSIEKRGFQGWVKYSLAMIADLKNLAYIPIVEYPPVGSVRASWSKPEHIRGLQPVVRNNLIWLQEEHQDVVEDFEFYPNVKWDDFLDSTAQGLEYWPFTVDEAELALNRTREANYLQTTIEGPGRFIPPAENKPFNEAEWLRQFDASGYSFNN